jgi:hypothetical protein
MPTKPFGAQPMEERDHAGSRFSRLAAARCAGAYPEPAQPSFGSGPTRVSYSTPLVRAVAAFLITTAFIATLIWLAVRLVIGFL